MMVRYASFDTVTLFSHGQINPHCSSIKGTVVPVHAVNISGEIEVWLHSFLTSVLDGGEWSTSCPNCFIRKEIFPGTYLMGGRVYTGTVLDSFEKR